MSYRLTIISAISQSSSPHYPFVTFKTDCLYIGTRDNTYNMPYM